MKTKIFLFATLFSISFFIGCSSNEKVDTSAVFQTITTDDLAIDSEIDTTIDDVSLIAEDQFLVQQSIISKTSTPIKSVLPTCATITTVLTNDTYTKTIDFGTTACTLANGNSVKGKIIISFSKSATTLSRTISYSLVDFYHNGKLVEGNKTIVVEIRSSDLLAALHPVITHSYDVKITFADGKVYTRTGTRIREMTEGFSTVGDWEDNVFLITGNHVTTFPNGTIFSATIITPLRIALSCKNPFPVSGVVTINKNDKVATLDFGNETCDFLATITINGITKEFQLRK